MSVEKTVENVYIRQHAVQLTRRYFWPLLGMTAIVYGVIYGLNHLLTLLGDWLMAPEIEAYLSSRPSDAQLMIANHPAMDALGFLFTSPKYLLYNLLCIIVSALVSNGLTMGYLRQQISIGRGNAPRVSGVFQQMRFCLKAWGLNLWLGLKATLWALPGLAVFFTGMELLGASDDFDTIGNLLGWVGILLLFAFVIRAFLHYSQALRLLADEPDRSIRDCAAYSTGLMKGRKWQFFKVGIPAQLKAAGAYLAVTIIIGVPLELAGLMDDAASSNLLDMVSSLAMVYFILQMNMVYALYYLKLREPVSDKPVSYWLRDHTTADIAPYTLTDSLTEAPADIFPETHDEAKENAHEEPDC